MRSMPSLLVWSAALLSLLAACTSGPRAAPRRPNIVLIFSDDHAAHALSCYGGTLDRTPQLDRLAAQGARFTQAFVSNSLCGPSRACVLTGKYGHRNGFVQNGQTFDGGQWTVARELTEAGYATAAVGKWHLGIDPREAGFQRGVVLPGQGRYVDPVFLVDGARTVVPGYATDAITDQAIAWLQERPRDRPFFLMVGHKAPHREWTPPDRLVDAYRARTFAEPATLFDDHATRLDGARNTEMTVARHLTRTDVKLDPPTDLQGDALTRWYYQRYIQDYLACVQALDENVGRLVDWLDGNGLRDDTVVIYTTDNGFFLGDHGWYDKRWMYEESMRVPLIVRWPGRTRPGSVVDAMTTNVDFAPTFLAAAEAPPPPGLQGRDLTPVLAGAVPADWRRSVYYRYYEFPGTHSVALHWGVRTADHKLIWFPEQQGWELYDLRRDPQELRNVAADPMYAAVRRELEVELARLRAELGDDDQVAVR